MERLAIVGFANVGKTSLFNAVTGQDAAVGAFPYTTTAVNTGVARLADDALAAAAECEGSAKVVPATVELLDLPAPAAKGGDGLGGEYLGQLREVDALCVVLRAFTDESVPAAAGSDPAEQAEELGLELALADAAVVGKRATKAEKEAAADKALAPVAAAFTEAARAAEDGTALRTIAWSPAARAAFRETAPLTLKPVVWVVNVAESEAESDASQRHREAVTAVVPGGDAVVVVSARLEAEATQLGSSERAELLAAFGLEESALARVVSAMHEVLDLITFYTLNPKEAHAWTVRRGTPVRVAAGKVHSDMERGFIRAEVGPIADVVAAGGWTKAREAGVTRVEARDYEVRHGDVVHVRFSV